MKRLIIALLLCCIGLTHAMVNPTSVRTPAAHPGASQPADADDMAAPPVPIHHISSAPRVQRKRDKRNDTRAKSSPGRYETPTHKRPHRYSLLIAN